MPIDLFIYEVVIEIFLNKYHCNCMLMLLASIELLRSKRFLIFKIFYLSKYEPLSWIQRTLEISSIKHFFWHVASKDQVILLWLNFLNFYIFATWYKYSINSAMSNIQSFQYLRCTSKELENMGNEQMCFKIQLNLIKNGTFQV